VPEAGQHEDGVVEVRATGQLRHELKGIVVEQYGPQPGRWMRCPQLLDQVGGGRLIAAPEHRGPAAVDERNFPAGRQRDRTRCQILQQHRHPQSRWYASAPHKYKIRQLAATAS
jgi:hypothetical protein